jgi:hypothetical protein
MGISKKQFTLAAKAGLTREQASRFIGTAGQEPSPTEAYDKVGQLLKGRTPGQAMNQIKPELKKPEPASSAKAGIKPIEPEVSATQPPEQPKVDATSAQELIKPVEQPKPFEKRNIKAVPKALAKKQYYQDFVEYDFSKQDPKLNTLFGNILSGEEFEEIGLPLKIKSFKYKSHIWETNEYNTSTGEIINRKMEFSVSEITEAFGYGFNTLMHEAGHLIDAYVGNKTTKDKMKITLRNGKVVGEYFANNHLSDDKNFTKALNIYTTAFKNNDPAIESKLKDFVDFSKKIHDEGVDVNLYPEIGEVEKQIKQFETEQQQPIVEKMLAAMANKNYDEGYKYDEELIQLRTKAGYAELKTKKIELEKKYDKFNTKRTAQAMEDIVASLTLGYGNSKYNLTNGHDIKYYKQRPYGKNHEIFTHYLTMKAHPDRRFLNKFKEVFPDLDSELERLYETAYQVMGSRK